MCRRRVLGAVLGRRLRRAQRLLDRRVDGVELVVARQDLRDPAAACVVEGHEIAHEAEETAPLERALQHHLELRKRSRRVALAADRAPGLEPLLPGAERADARLDAVRDDERRVRSEGRGDLRLIGLALLPRRPDGGLLVGRVLEHDHRERQAVDEQHHVGPARVLALGDGERVHGQPVVVRGIVEVDQPRLVAGDGTILAAVLHRPAVHQNPTRRAIAFDERRGGKARELAEGVFERLGRERRVEPRERLAQPAFENGVAVARVAALRARLARGDLGAVPDRVAERLEPGERGVFDDRLRECPTHEGSHNRRTGTANRALPKLIVAAPS